MKIKNKLIMQMTIGLALLFVSVAYGNSGPAIQLAPPSYELAVLEDCPIFVEREKLTFNMADVYETYGSHAGAAVTASYKMFNPGDEKLPVMMVFPIVGTSYSKKQVASITANGEAVPYELMYGDLVSTTDEYGIASMYDYFHDPEGGALFSEKVQMENLLETVTNKDNLEPLENGDSHYRIMCYVFTVDFEPVAYTDVSVSYYAEAYWDRSDLGAYDSARQCFMYILNPAKGWADFGGIDIEVIPGSSYPYLVETNMDFEKTAEGAYAAALEELPEYDLIFTMYDKKTVRKSYTLEIMLIIFILIIIVAVCSIIAGLIFILKRIRRLF